MAPARYRDALRFRDFRLLITAFLIDHTGSWAYNVALVVYAFDRTGSATWVSVFLAANWVPKALLAPYAGLLADRFERTALMRLSALGSFAVMTGLALLIYADAPLPALLVTSVLAAVVLAPYNPAAQALLVDSVDEVQLPAANALFLTVENLVVVVGPALGGLLLLLGEPATVVALNAMSFLATLLLVTRIRTRSRGGAREETADSVLHDIEFVSALRGLVSRGQLMPSRADDALSDYDDLNIERWPAGNVLRRRVMQLRHSLSAYEAAYVVLAEALDCPLLTRDLRLARSSGHRVAIEVR